MFAQCNKVPSKPGHSVGANLGEAHQNDHKEQTTPRHVRRKPVLQSTGKLGFSKPSPDFPSQPPADRGRPHTQIEQYSLHTAEAVHPSRAQTERLRSYSLPPSNYKSSSTLGASQHELMEAGSDHEISHEATIANTSTSHRSNSPIEEHRFSNKPVQRESRGWVMVRKAPVILPRAITGIIVPNPRDDELWLNSATSSGAEVSPPSSAIQSTELHNATCLVSPLQPEPKPLDNGTFSVRSDHALGVPKLPPFQPLSLSLDSGPTLCEEIFGPSTKLEAGVCERKKEISDAGKR
jgi:hypothetical protein